MIDARENPVEAIPEFIHGDSHAVRRRSFHGEPARAAPRSPEGSLRSHLVAASRVFLGRRDHDHFGAMGKCLLKCR